MKSRRPSFALAAGLLTLFAAGAARADYVDFTTIGWTSQGSLTTTVNGVQITVTSSDGWVSTFGEGGLYGYSSKYDDQYGSSDNQNNQLSISFSTPVQLVSADLFDYFRSTASACYSTSCSALPVGSQVATYSVDGSLEAPAVATAPASATSTTGGGTLSAADYGFDYTYTQSAAGWAGFGGPSADYNSTQGIGQTGSTIVFTGTTSYTVPPDSYDYTYGETHYGIRGITFNISSVVPELNASAVTTALALLLGALVLMTERRRRATGRA